jgi:hypothetical protein
MHPQPPAHDGADDLTGGSDGHRFRSAWRARTLDPLDDRALCTECRLRFIFENRRPRPPALRWPLLYSAGLVLTATAVWLKYQDPGAVVAVLVCATLLVLVWWDWSEPCAHCQNVRQPGDPNTGDRSLH